MSPRYVSEPADWARIARALLSSPQGAGLDTEFYGVQLRGAEARSVYGRGLVHVWSVALPTAALHPRGYRRATSAVFPLQALEHPDLRTWLESPEHVKYAHNAGVDVHALENTAHLRLAGVQDTLQMARWYWPERVEAGYDLKTLAVEILGQKITGKFDELFSRPRTVERVRRTRVVTCSCGVPGCRKRLGHEKTTEILETKETVELKTREEVPLPEIVPGHPLWETLVKYAGEDAEWAIELVDLMQRPRARSLPW